MSNYNLIEFNNGKYIIPNDVKINLIIAKHEILSKGTIVKLLYPIRTDTSILCKIKTKDNKVFDIDSTNLDIILDVA